MNPDEDVDWTVSGGCCLVTKLYLTLLQPRGLIACQAIKPTSLCGRWILLWLSHQGSHIYIYIYIFFFFCHYRLLQDIKHSSLCCSDFICQV